MLPFGRFPGVDTVLGPEMKSTGEVMGIDARLRDGAREGDGGGGPRPARRRDRVRQRGEPRQEGHRVPREAPVGHGLPTPGDRRHRGRAPACGDPGRACGQGERGPRQRRRADPRRAGSTWSSTRRSAGARARTATSSARRRPSAGVPCITTLPGVFAAVRGIEALRGAPTEPRSIQEHHAEALRRAARRRGSRSRRRRPPRSSGRDVVTRVRAEVLSTRKLGAYSSLTLVAPEIAEKARPGQFLAVADARGPGVPAARHFAIHQASRRGGWAGTLEFVVDPAGAGTDVARTRQGPRVPRRDRPARQGVLLSEEPHELPADRRGPRRGVAVLPGAGAARARASASTWWWAPRRWSASSSRSRASGCRRRSRS